MTTNVMNALRGPVAVIETSHADISAMYGCAATMTLVRFTACGVTHTVRRFWREDAPTTGKLELYTHESYPGAEWTCLTPAGWYGTTTEDFLRYIERGATDAISTFARALVHGLISGRAGDALGADTAARYAALELY